MRLAEFIAGAALPICCDVVPGRTVHLYRLEILIILLFITIILITVLFTTIIIFHAKYLRHLLPLL
jgi:hypothetical protein